jgi:hypothetical protein
LTTRNDAKQRQTTCGYANGVDGINKSSTCKRLVWSGAAHSYVDRLATKVSCLCKAVFVEVTDDDHCGAQEVDDTPAPGPAPATPTVRQSFRAVKFLTVGDTGVPRSGARVRHVRRAGAGYIGQIPGFGGYCIGTARGSSRRPEVVIVSSINTT